MPEAFLYDLGVDALGQQQCRCCMARVVEPDRLQSGSFQQRKERSPQEVALAKRAAVYVAEKEAI